MNTYTRQIPETYISEGSSGGSSQSCGSDNSGPADQPRKPCGERCPALPNGTPPILKEPEKCPPARCDCPAPPPTTSTCLDDMIAKQAKEIKEGERAKQFKTDLEALLATAKAATVDYTPDKYKKLLAEWERLDADIAEFIRKLVCAVHCWRCIVECQICPMIYDIRAKEQMLYGNRRRYDEVHSLNDLLYWHDINRQEKMERLTRIKSVLSAWEKPAATIEKVLADNAKLLAECGRMLAPDAGKLVYDVFLKLVPMHLAIAPPASSGKVTRIAREFIAFCECDTGDPDDCCGPDVGIPTLRQRLIQPQPYLIPPGEYFEVICCLAKQRYLPAKEAWSAAESAYESVADQIKRYTDDIAEGLKNFDQNARAALPADCSDWNGSRTSSTSAS